jgi:hypothetical protein
MKTPIDQGFCGVLTHDGGVIVARLKGRCCETPIDSAEVDAFCAVLRDHTYANSKASIDHLDLIPLPKGYRNLRVYDQRDGKMLGSRWHVGNGETTHHAGIGFISGDRRPTARTVVAIAQSAALEEIVSWRATFALPTVEKGVLDLVVDICTRPRQFTVLGERLPQYIIDAISADAPLRASGLGPRSYRPRDA